MNSIKLFAHDARCGLMRIRYAVIPIIFLIPCISFYSIVKIIDCSFSWADCMMYCFQGIKPVYSGEGPIEFHLPINWLLIMAGCLFLNLDYMLNDMTNYGQQVIIRSNNRIGWFLAKCIWNLCSTVMYFCIGCLSAALFTVVTGGSLKMESTPQISLYIFSSLLEDVSIETFFMSKPQVFMYCFLFPALCLATLNLLQMTLCLYIKPILSFIFGMCILIISLFWNSPLALGNGAMLLRSDLLFSDGIKPESVIVVSLCILFFCPLAGSCKFKRKDILNVEE